MIDLGQRAEPYQIALPYGLSVTVKPLTTAGMAAAQAAARRAVEAIERQARERTEAGLALDGLPDFSAEGERDGFYQAQLIRELAVRHVTRWTGVGLEGGPAAADAGEHRRGDGRLPGGRAVLPGVHAPPGAAERRKKRVYGRLPPCKGVPRSSGMIRSAAGMYPAFDAAVWPLGLDEIRGWLPIIRASSRLCVFFGLHQPRSDRSCHHVREHLRSSWKLALRGQMLEDAAREASMIPFIEVLD
jgi:hypothetical protein